MPDEYYDRYFPNLKKLGYKRTSEPEYYNCIAYAASDTIRKWWPDNFPPGSKDYWPLPVSDAPDESIESFLAGFATIGYSKCHNGSYEAGYEKVSFYAVGKEVRHAARQMHDGTWRSKLGPDEDIEHTLEGLEGWFYGNIVAFAKRPIQGYVPVAKRWSIRSALASMASYFRFPRS